MYAEKFLLLVRPAQIGGTDDATDGRGNICLTMNFKAEFVDAAADSITYDKSIYSVEDILDGDFSTTFKLVPPATTYLANVWGTPVWSSITNTQI